MRKKLLAVIIILCMILTIFGGCSEGVVSIPDSTPASNGDTASADGSSTSDSTTPASGTEDLGEGVASAYPDLKVKPDGKLKVGFVYHNIDTESQSRSYQQTKIETAHRGWELIECYFNTADEARTGIQSLITQDVDAIVIGNMDIVSVADLILQAREKGIGVYNIDCQLVEGVVSNACQPNGVAGAELAYKLGQDFLWEARYAVITNPVIQVQMERTEVAKSIFNQYPGMVMIGEEFVSGEGAAESRLQQAFNYAKRFFEMEGEDLDIIFCSYDSLANSCAEAAKQLSFDTDCAIIGVDGGSAAWSYIRDKESNFKYSYAQPTELYNHSTFELIKQLQVDGLKPGQNGCMLEYWGQAMYFTGYIVDENNVPDVGESIHAAFNYYDGDPNDSEAWYNWSEAGGPTMIK